MIIRSGANCSITCFRAFPKSPTREQQIHPEFISVILIPASFRKPPSIPISPNSFSISTIFCPANTSFISFLINVVFPAPRKPEIISIFVISVPVLSFSGSFRNPAFSAAAFPCGSTRHFLLLCIHHAYCCPACFQKRCRSRCLQQHALRYTETAAPIKGFLYRKCGAIFMQESK